VLCCVVCWGKGECIQLQLRQHGLAVNRIPLPLLTNHPKPTAQPTDYKVSLAYAPPPGPERQAVLSDCHKRGAERLLALCFANGGIYTKLGARLRY